MSSCALVGSAVAKPASPERMSKPGSTAAQSLCRSISGTPSRMQIACMGSSAATAARKSIGSPSPIGSSSTLVRWRSSSSSRRIMRGVRPLDTSRRMRLWRGSSIMFSTSPAMSRSCSRVPPAQRPPPPSDEYVTASFWICSVSAYVATDQKPSPSGVCAVGSCQNTGATRRWTAKTSCGKPAAKLSRSVRSASPSGFTDRSVAPTVDHVRWCHSFGG